MDLNYEFKRYQWEVMEDAQEKLPHLWLGWYGFVLMIVLSGA